MFVNFGNYVVKPLISAHFPYLYGCIACGKSILSLISIEVQTEFKHLNCQTRRTKIEELIFKYLNNINMLWNIRTSKLLSFYGFKSNLWHISYIVVLNKSCMFSSLLLIYVKINIIFFLNCFSTLQAENTASQNCWRS